MHNKDVARRRWFGKEFLRRRYRARDFYLGLALLGFALLLNFWLIPHYVEDVSAHAVSSIGPSLFPRAMAIALLFFSIALVYISPSTSEDVSRLEDKKINGSMVGCVGILLLYYLGIFVIGMLVASILALCALLWLFGLRLNSRLFFPCMAFVVLLFLFFEKVANVPIPRGLVFKNLF